MPDSQKDEYSFKEHFNSKGNIKEPDESDIVEELIPKEDFSPSDKEKERAAEALKETTKLPDEFELAKIGDIDFLLSIFAEPYDSYKSLPYLLKMRDKLLKRGYPETPILNEYLFWTTISRRLQIEYQIVHVRNVKKGRIEAEPIQHLKLMKGVAEQIIFLQKSLNDTLEKFEKVSSIVDLHQETLDEIEKFVREHIGEYSFKCRSCDAIISTQGLPHWAIQMEMGENGSPMYYTFSPEAWYLVKKKLLPLYAMAFILRTSPEGVILTAEKRGIKIKRDIFNLEQEEKSLASLMKGLQSETG